MKLLPALLLLAATAASASDAVNLSKEQLGNAGEPAQTTTVGTQAATPIGDGLYFVPQYLTGFPTAATIWPRAVSVDCSRTADGALDCAGFHWEPKMGRGEYLFVVPKIKEAPAQPAPVVVEKKVFIEVPTKKGRE